jgi:hypothetical protein
MLKASWVIIVIFKERSLNSLFTVLKMPPQASNMSIGAKPDPIFLDVFISLDKMHPNSHDGLSWVLEFFKRVEYHRPRTILPRVWPLASISNA